MESKDNSFILTIAIPTYNRPDKIKKQVLSLIPQLTDETRLVIIDNSSDVEVASLFNDIDLPINVVVVRNKCNIGADANIAKCFELCETKWLWTLSDDDILDNNAVKQVLCDIKKHQDFIFINYNRNRKVITSGLQEFALEGCKMYTYLFWLSVCVYNTKALRSYYYFYYQALSTMHPGVAMLTKYLADNDGNTMLSDTKIVIDGGKEISWKRENFVYSALIMCDVLRDYSKVLNPTFFRALTDMCFNSIYKILPQKQRLLLMIKLFFLVVKRRGIINIIRYNFQRTFLFFPILLKKKLLHQLY